jgi:hypothetical protein
LKLILLKHRMNLNKYRINKRMILQRSLSQDQNHKVHLDPQLLVILAPELQSLPRQMKGN